MAANRRKQDDKNLEILRELISLNGNKYCLDCNQRGPTYVNATIGSFVCSKCSGMLRGLTPPHRVKSISMATFTPAEIEFIKIRGNEYCRLVWLGLYEGESVNFTDEQSVKDFMSDKYEKKRYYLEPTPRCNIVNNVTLLNEMRCKRESNGPVASQLVSIAAPAPNPSNNNTHNSSKMVNNLLSTVDTNHKLARPVNNSVTPMNKNTTAPIAAPVPVPDFPVDFSTANIYNSSQFSNMSNNNNNMNNFFSQPSTSPPMFSTFNNTTTSTTNDRYAALADLDLALRQQNMKNMEENGGVSNRNPFQCSTNEVIANRNPFCNGSWSTAPNPLPINPFMPSTNNGSFVNSKNPFL